MEGGSYPGAPSYTVYSVSGVTYAKDQNGHVEFSGTNATTTINNALGNGGTTQLVGDILIDSVLLVPSNTTLLNTGTLTWIGIDSLSAYMISNLDRTGGNSRIEIIGGSYDGGNKVGSIINMDHVSYFKIENTYQTNIKELGAFTVLWNSHDGIFSENLIYGNNKGLGIDLYDGCHNIVVSQNTFNQTYDSAISIGSSGTGILCYGISVVNNVANGYSAGNGMGVSVFGLARDITIVGNIISDMKFDGINTLIDTFTPDTVTISGNIIRNVGRHGISLDSSNSTVSANIIINATEQGIRIAANGNSVIGNMVKDCAAGAGLYIYTLTNQTVVSGNTFTFNDYGINVGTDATGTLIIGNNLGNNTIANLLDNGIGTVNQHNIT